MSTSNAIERKMKIKSILEGKFNAGNAKEAAGKTVLNVGLGLVAGGAISALLGKPSFWAGILTTGLAYFTGLKFLAPVGIGMTTTSLAVEGDTVKERFTNIGNAIFSKSYADKLVEKFKGTQTAKTAAAPESTNGFGAVAESAQLDDIEKQLVASAMEYQRQQGRPANGVDNGYVVEGFSDETDTSTF